jgi:hypothetical protein
LYVPDDTHTREAGEEAPPGVGGTWLCTQGGVPFSFFLIDEDVSTGDGAVVCKRVDSATALRALLRASRVARLLLEFP